MATKAFPALIVVNFESPNWTNLTDLLAKVAHLAQLKYNYTYTHGRMSRCPVYRDELDRSQTTSLIAGDITRENKL